MVVSEEAANGKRNGRGNGDVERMGFGFSAMPGTVLFAPPLAFRGSGGGLAPVPGLANKANPARASPVGAAQGHATGPPATSWSDSGKDRTHASASTSDWAETRA